MKIIDLKKPRTGTVIRRTKMDSLLIRWHYDTYGDRFITMRDMKEKFYGQPRYKVIK